MKQIWFKNAGWFYIPIHPLGFAVTILAIVFMVPIVMAVVQRAYDIG